jgi:hypothetical protein
MIKHELATEVLARSSHDEIVDRAAELTDLA